MTSWTSSSVQIDMHTLHLGCTFYGLFLDITVVL